MLEDGRWLCTANSFLVAEDDEDGFLGTAGGDKFSSVDARTSGGFDGEPAKLLRRLAAFDLLSGSES